MGLYPALKSCLTAHCLFSSTGPEVEFNWSGMDLPPKFRFAKFKTNHRAAINKDFNRISLVFLTWGQFYCESFEEDDFNFEWVVR